MEGYRTTRPLTTRIVTQEDKGDPRAGPAGQSPARPMMSGRPPSVLPLPAAVIQAVACVGPAAAVAAVVGVARLAARIARRWRRRVVVRVAGPPELAGPGRARQLERP